MNSGFRTRKQPSSKEQTDRINSRFDYGNIRIRKKHSSLFRRTILPGLVFVAAIIGAWELIRITGKLDQTLWPSVPSIGTALLTAFQRGHLTAQIAISLGLVLSGLSTGFILALILAFAGERFSWFKPVIRWGISFFHPIPGIALLPIIILWAGTGWWAIYLIIVHSVLWPLITNILQGFDDQPLIYAQVADNYCLGFWRRFWQVKIPAAASHIFAGSKIAWSRAWRGLISAEMVFGAVTGVGGIGWFMFSRRVFMDTPGMFAGLIIIIILGIVMELGVFTFLDAVTLKRWGN